MKPVTMECKQLTTEAVIADLTLRAICTRRNASFFVPICVPAAQLAGETSRLRHTPTPEPKTLPIEDLGCADILSSILSD